MRRRPKKIPKIVIKKEFTSPETVLLNQKLHSMVDGLKTMVQQRTRFFMNHSGDYTTQGGSNTEDILVPEVKPGMLCFVQMKTLGASPVSILTAKCDDGKITIMFSDDPSDDHELSYFVFTHCHCD